MDSARDGSRLPHPDLALRAMSYHDLHITTERIPRTAISDLPFGYEVACNRVGGWCLWLKDDAGVEHLVAGEYDDDGMILDAAGHVIVDSLTPKPVES